MINLKPENYRSYRDKAFDADVNRGRVMDNFEHRGCEFGLHFYFAL